MVIGNDIVDLKVVRQNPKAQNPKFLRKVLTESELQVVRQSKDAELSLWIHWALKESAYKADFQINQKRYFAPKKLICEFSRDKDNLLTAKITTPFKKYLGQITITKNYIHTVAIPPSLTFDAFLHQIIFVPTSIPPSASIRKHLSTYLIQNYAIKKEHITIQKINDIPFLNIQNQQYPLSFSHHGKWAAWTIKKPSATKQMTQIF